MSSSDNPLPKVDVDAARFCSICGGWGTIRTTGIKTYILCPACQTPSEHGHGLPEATRADRNRADRSIGMIQVVVAREPAAAGRCNGTDRADALLHAAPAGADVYAYPADLTFCGLEVSGLDSDLLQFVPATAWYRPNQAGQVCERCAEAVRRL